MTAPPTRAPVVDVALPDLGRWASGNTGLPYAWRFGEGSPRVTVQALTHGNEVCGAIALDWLLRSGLRPLSGTLTLVFANTAAYHAFDAGDPFAARCLDEDFNRLWDAAVLDGARQSRELARARELRPLYDATDFLLDLHSMSDPCPALALSGRQRKGVALARALGIPRFVVIDAGHQAGRRLRDYAHFDDALDPRNALLVECGQHWESAAPIVAQQVMLRFLRHFSMLDDAFVEAHIATGEPPDQQTIAVTDAVTIETDAFAFVGPVAGMMAVAQRGTLIAHDGKRDIFTPYDDCVLIMPTRRPRKGETAVRLGRYVA
ncbi:MAG: succinylglutamate desuccinylase/aspartoacylase family protein [Betaproteobacteria bacterium]